MTSRLTEINTDSRLTQIMRLAEDDIRTIELLTFSGEDILCVPKQDYDELKQTVKQMVELIRQMQKALEKYERRQSMEDLEYAGYAGSEALMRLEKFDKGE